MRVLRYLVPSIVAGAVVVLANLADRPVSATPADHAGLTSPRISQCLRLHDETGAPCLVKGGPSDGTYVDEQGELHYPS